MSAFHRVSGLRTWSGIAALLTLPVGALWLLSGSQIERADFVFNNGGEVATLDPHAGSGVPEWRVARALFEGLVTPGPSEDFEPLPAAAESWEVTADGRTYVFHLREGLAWSNGEPLTAEDFEWSFRRQLEPKTAAPYAYLLDAVTGAADYRTGRSTDWSSVAIRARDPRTLELELLSTAPLLEILAHPAFVPVHRGSIERAQETHPGTWQVEWLRPERLVVNGPFRIRERRVNDRLRLERNAAYWDRDHVAFETIDILAVEHLGTALNLYLTGAIDWLDGTIPPELVEPLRPREDFLTWPYLGVYFYRFNVTRPPFDDVRVRRAFAAAIDREAIVEKLLGGVQRSALSMTPASFKGYLPPRLVPLLPEERTALFEQSGYGGENRKPFPRVAIHFNNTELHRSLAELIAAGWTKAFGVPIGLAPQEQKMYLDAQRNLDYDVSRSSWIADFVGPESFLEIWTSDSVNNRTGWSNPEYDALIEQARLEPHQGKQNELHYQAEELLLRELPFAPIFFYNSQNLVNPRLGGFALSLLNDQQPKNWYWMDDAELAEKRKSLPTQKRPIGKAGGPRQGQYSAAARAARAAAAATEGGP
jgi:oligopeptide transport system substrate-binding protein